MRALMLTVVSAAALAAPAAAESYAVGGVQIEHAAAIVSIVPEDRSDVDVEIIPSARLPAPRVRVTGARAIIDGGLGGRLRGCRQSMLNQRTVAITGLGNVPHADLPRITIRMPRTLDLDTAGAVFADIGQSQAGRVQFSGCGDVAMASVARGLDLRQLGSGDVIVAAVGGALNARLQGSGDLHFASAGMNAMLRLEGSGDLTVAVIAGGAEAELDGSGSLRLGPVGADARVALNGSGDLVVGDVAGALDATLEGSGELRAGAAQAGARVLLNGSGDANVGVVRGSLEARATGAGELTVAAVFGSRTVLHVDGSADLDVRAGETERLEATSRGAGELHFGGRAGATSATLESSGDIVVADAGRMESLVDRGSGDVRFGSR